jgi:predicted O-methyltransferase YrrM
MHEFFRTKEFLKHRFTAGDEHDIHSPFLYDLYTNVICDNSAYYAFDKIESVRSKMLLSNEKIPVHDFGTGGEEKKQRLLTLGFIARNYIKPAKEGQLLFRLVNYFKPKTILEIGTSLGITTLYLAAPLSSSTVITLEGCPNTSAVARKNFERLAVKNIHQEIGEFSKSLPLALAKTEQLDFVYFDGNHRKIPTVNYFNACLQQMQPSSVFVFDDIHWSREMSEAWNEIKSHRAVTMSVDLYSMGIIFFREASQVQHFRLKF